MMHKATWAPWIVGNIQSETTVIKQKNMYMKNWEAIGSDETFNWACTRNSPGSGTLQWEGLQPFSENKRNNCPLGMKHGQHGYGNPGGPFGKLIFKWRIVHNCKLVAVDCRTEGLFRWQSSCNPSTMSPYWLVVQLPMYIATSPGLLLLKSSGKPRPSYSNTTKKIEKSLITFFAGFYFYLPILLLYLFLGLSQHSKVHPRGSRGTCKRDRPDSSTEESMAFRISADRGRDFRVQTKPDNPSCKFLRNLGGK